MSHDANESVTGIQGDVQCICATLAFRLVIIWLGRASVDITVVALAVSHIGGCTAPTLSWRARHCAG